MKKNTLIICIVAAVLVVCLGVVLFFVLGGNKAPETPNTPETPAEKTYTLALSVDTAIDEEGVLTNYVATLLLDDASKIVAVRLDCVEVTPSVKDGAIADVASILSKVAQGENYGGTAAPSYMQMAAGSFAKLAAICFQRSKVPQSFKYFIVKKNLLQ